MKILFTTLTILTSISIVHGQKSHLGRPSLNYTEAIGYFISEKKSINYPIGDTLVFFNLDSSVVDTIPRTIKETYLKFITWEETQRSRSTNDTIYAFQIVTTNFDDFISFIFLPLKITNDDILREYENICRVGYYIDKKNMRAQYKGVDCSSGFIMSE